MVITDILTEFGAYYLKNGQNVKRLFTLLFRKEQTQELLTTIMTDETVWRGSKASISKLLQPFQKKWTPQGTATFSPLSIALFKVKMDYEENPDDLEDSWLGFLADKNLDRKAWPFIRYVVEDLIIPKMAEERELEAIFYGRREEAATSVAGEPYQIADGLRIQRNNAVKDGKTTPIAIGAWDADDALLVDQFEEFADGIGKAYWNQPMVAGVNETIIRRYARGYRKKYGKDIDFKGNMMKIIDTNISLRGLPSMGSSQSIWCTPNGNAVRLLKKKENINKFTIESVDRLVKIFTDFWLGYGFVLGELIFTNDLDLGAATIDTVLPLAAGTAGGTAMTLTGRDFLGATAVKFGTVSGSVFTPVGANCANMVIGNDRQLTCDSPAVAANTYAVQVTNEFGATHTIEQVVVS